jgi:hypothetical protein
MNDYESTGHNTLQLNASNIEGYVTDTVLPALPGAELVDIREVDPVQSAANWVFQVNARVAGAPQTVYVRQTGDHIKIDPTKTRDVARIEAEVQTLAALDRIVPDSVPKVLLFDQPNHIVVLSDAKRDGSLLAEELKAGRINQEAGKTFGSMIAAFQVATRGRSLTEILGPNISPPKATDMSSYLADRTKDAREHHPELTDKILADSEAAPRTFILGDLASKNVFIDGSAVRLIDFERVFVGDPAYDPAYVLCHYLIDARGEHAPEQTVELVDGFMNAYTSKLAEGFSRPEIDTLQTRILHHLGMSIWHRTGKSPFAANYDGPRELWQQRAPALMATDSSSVAGYMRNMLASE